MLVKLTVIVSYFPMPDKKYCPLTVVEFLYLFGYLNAQQLEYEYLAC